MKFDDFLEISAEGDFTLKDMDPDGGVFQFESHYGDRVHIRRSPVPVNDSVQPWIVLVNGETVTFDNPSQLVSMDTIITGLCSKGLQKLIDEGKASRSRKKGGK
jgi:hypothetical protein